MAIDPNGLEKFCDGTFAELEDALRALNEAGVEANATSAEFTLTFSEQNSVSRGKYVPEVIIRLREPTEDELDEPVVKS